jgi:formamidopyrimidine-DNA glycosylase
MNLKAYDILDLSFKPANQSSSSARPASEVRAGSYSHAGYDECPVCKNKMVEAKIKSELVYFCPEHRISFPQKV